MPLVSPQMTIYSIIFVAVTTHIAHAGSRVALSLYALDLGASQITIGVLVALNAFCPVFLSIAIGRFADRVPPRLPMIVGAMGIGLALLLPPTFQSIAVLYVASFVLGLCNQLFNIPVDATVGGIGGAEKRVHNYAVLSMGWSFAGFLGPLIAGFSIDYVGHVRGFLVLAAFTVVPTLILWFKLGLPAKVVKHGGEKRHGSVFDLWRIPSLRTTYIAAGGIGAAADVFQFYLPIYGHSVGLSASAIGTILGVVALATFVIRGAIPMLAKWLTETEILGYAVFIAAFAFVLLPFFVNPYALAAIGFLLGLGVGCGNPMAMSLLYVLTPPGRIAESTGLRKTVNHSTNLVAPLIFSSVGAAFGFTTVFISSAVVLTIGGFLMLKARLPSSGLRQK